MENIEKKSDRKNNHGCLWAFGAFGLILIVSVVCMNLSDKGSASSGRADYRTELDGDLDYVEYSHQNKDERKIVDRWTNKVVLDNLTWISHNEGDSLIAYAQKNRRGYLNLRSRKATLLDEKFVKIYLYREGRALAESLDSLYVLDTRMREVSGYKKTDERDTEVNYYHKGYLPMIGENGKLGLVDTCGVWAIEPQYDKVSWALDEFWLGITNPVMVDEVTGKETAPHRIMMDSHLRTVMEGDWTYLMVTKDGYVTVADRNHWQWHYDLNGNVIDDFVCKDIQQMTFTTGEKKWLRDPNGVMEYDVRQVDVEETATLLKYVTSEDWEGLMTQEGRIVTPPVFWQITAISKNLYLCKYDTSSEHGILLNEKGERVSIDGKYRMK